MTLTKSSLTLLPLILFALPACAAPLALEDDTAKISYSLGYQIGGDFKQQQVGMNADAVVQGIQDALAGSEPLLSQTEMNDLLVALKEKVVDNQRKEVFQSSKTFLDANRKKEGVTELPSGVQYRVIKAGSGTSPTLTDTVDLHFDAKRTDGTVVSTTHTGDGKPRSYPVGKATPQLREVLLKMQPGARWEVVVPPSNRNKLTESGGALIYDLELVAVHPTKAGEGS